MESKAFSKRMDEARAHPLAELLACPAEVGNLLNKSVQHLDVAAGAMVFRQSAVCRGLYVVAAGEFQRQTERLGVRLTLAPVRAGELVELAAALGEAPHTYTLTAQTAGSLLLLPSEAVNLAFQLHPPLRMQLLEELAREVSRAYIACCLNRKPLSRGGRLAGGGARGLYLSL